MTAEAVSVARQGPRRARQAARHLQADREGAEGGKKADKDAERARRRRAATTARRDPAPEPPASSGGGARARRRPVDPRRPAGAEARSRRPTRCTRSRSASAAATAGATKGYLTRAPRCRRPTSPLLVYLGLLEDDKTAVFLLDSTVTAVGRRRVPSDAARTARRSACRRATRCSSTSHGEDGERPASSSSSTCSKINKKQTTDAAKSARRPRSSKRRRALARAHGAVRAPRAGGSALPASLLGRIRSHAEAPRPEVSRRLPGVSLRVITAGESHGPGLTMHRRGPARRARARPRGDQRATWPGASSATAAAGA